MDEIARIITIIGQNYSLTEVEKQPIFILKYGLHRKILNGF